MIRYLRCRRVAVVLIVVFGQLPLSRAWGSGAEPLVAAVRATKPLIDARTALLRWSGERSVNAGKLGYFASYAQEHECRRNPLRFDLDSLAIELIGTVKGWSFGGGFEELEGDGVKGFATPLATFHKFLGWADKFTTTPPNGLQREYATVGYTRPKVAGLDSLGATVVYHRFESSRFGIDYGHEVDLQLQGKWHHVTGLIKYANYDARSFATDTRKFWMQVEYVL
jgi:hypothetical protein